MQELRKTLRKVAAIGASVAMLGMTVTGALAADMTLADYPAPFKNGGDTVVVYGIAGTSEDTAAAGDIISGLPAVAATTTTDTTSTSNAGTVELDQKFSKDMLMGTFIGDSADTTSFGSEVRDTTLPGLKNKQILISIGANSGTYDTHEKINFSTDSAFLATGLTMGQLNTSGEKYGNNILLRFGQSSMNYYYKFDASLAAGTNVTASTQTYPIQLDFLGKTLEITGATTNTITAISGDKFNLEVYDSVVVNGKKVSVEAIGTSSAKVCVDGQCDTLLGTSGNSQTKTINGLSVRAQDLIDVGASASGGKSSVTLVIADATKTAALKTFNDGDYFIGQDKNNPLWVWKIGSLETLSPSIGVTLGQSLTSTSLSIPDYPLSHPPYVGDLLCLPNNYACITIESIAQSDDDFGNYEIKPDIRTLYNAAGTAAVATDAHVIQITSKSTTAGTGLKSADTASALTATSEIYIQLAGTQIANKSVNIFRKDTTTSKPLWVANYSLTDGTALGMKRIVLGTIDYKSTSIPLKLFAFNATHSLDIDAGLLTPANANAFMGTGIVNGSAAAATVATNYVQAKLIINASSDSGAPDDQLQVYIRESAADSNQLNYLGHRPNGGTYQSNDLLYIPGAGGNVLDISAYTGDTRGKDGWILQTPKTGIEGDLLRIQMPKDVTNYKAKVTLATTKGGAKATVIKGAATEASSIMMKDTDVTDLTKYNAIVVGGPAVNKVAAQLLGKEFPAYGANSGFVENEAVIELKKNGSNYALLVAGWEAADTQRAGVVLKNFASFKDTLKGTSVTVKGTDMTVAGITVA